jgi:CheY-like chemotaxis protein
MKTYKALVIDDDLSVCSEIYDRLIVIGHECVYVNTIVDAQEYLKNNICDYIVLDLELPAKTSSSPRIELGISFLKTLRKKYSKDSMPIIVMTAQTEQNVDVVADFVQYATDVIQKPLLSRGEHTLEASIAKFVEAEQLTSVESTECISSWLTREVKGRKVFWKTTSNNGQTWEYGVSSTAIRSMLLECILKTYKKTPIVNHYDIMKACGWCSSVYFSKNGGAPRGPLKGHVEVLRKELKMDITYVDNGIRVCQPMD